MRVARGQPIRIGSATAITQHGLIISSGNDQGAARAARCLDASSPHAARNIRIGGPSTTVNSSEKRLARTLLLLARYGKQVKPRQTVAKISQETLSEMVGTTRSRVNFFMNKFKKLGFIEYDGKLDAGIIINSSLLSVVLHD